MNKYVWMDQECLGFYQVYYQDLHLLTHQHYLVQKPYQDFHPSLDKDFKCTYLLRPIQ